MSIFMIMLSMILAFAPTPKKELSAAEIQEAKILVEKRHEEIRSEARARAEEKAKAEEQKKTIVTTKVENKAPETEVAEVPETETAPETETHGEALEYWGTYNMTFYCPCPQHCNSWIGARGNRLTQYYSVAMPNLPMGTVIEIRGSLGYDGRYIVEDISPRGICDIFVNDHSQIPAFGTCKAEIYIVR